MARTYVATGVALKDGTIRLDAGSGLPAGRVRVIVEADSPGARGSIFDVRPRPSPRSARRVLDDLRALRDEWDGRG